MCGIDDDDSSPTVNERIELPDDELVEICDLYRLAEHVVSGSAGNISDEYTIDSSELAEPVLNFNVRVGLSDGNESNRWVDGLCDFFVLFGTKFDIGEEEEEEEGEDAAAAAAAI